MLQEIFNHKNYKIDIEIGDIFSPLGKKLKPSKVWNSYYTVTVDRKRCKVHRLVLMTATQSDGNGLQVNHIDGNKANNSYKNLEWCTNQESIDHSNRIGLNPHRNLVIRKDRKLSDEQVILIKKAIKEGLTGKEITQKYNFANYKNIYAIKNGLSYKLVKDNTEVI